MVFTCFDKIYVPIDGNIDTIFSPQHFALFHQNFAELHFWVKLDKKRQSILYYRVK